MKREALVASALVVSCFMLVAGPSCRAAADRGRAVAQARKAAQAWLKLVDKGKYKQSWVDTAAYFKGRVPEQTWEEQVGAVRGPLGATVSRTFKRAHYATSLPGAPDGQYVVIQYKTSFKNKKSAVETVTPMLDANGKWRVCGYYIR